jgi:hypothetical protein
VGRRAAITNPTVFTELREVRRSTDGDHQSVS